MKKLKKLFPDTLTVKKSLYARRLFSFAAASAALASLSQQAEAQIIVQDGFSSGSGYGSGWAGHSPSNAIGGTPAAVNLPGGTWVVESGSTSSNYQRMYHNTTNSQYWIGSVHAFADLQGGNTPDMGLSLLSSGSYVEPNAFTYSASVDPAQEGGFAGGGGNQTTASAYMGFFSAASGGTNGNIVGLKLSKTGVLSFTTAEGGAVIASPGAGIFTSQFTTLTFNMSFNTSTDIATISGIVLDGTSYSNTASTGVLSPTGLNYAGFGSNENGPGGSAIDNLTISQFSATPEPSTYALLAGGALALGAYQYRRRQQGI